MATSRRYGATLGTIERSKVDVMSEIVREINPDVKLTCFPGGLTTENCREFVQGSHLVLDGIDFFAIEARRTLFRAAREGGLYALTAGPLGFGSTLHVVSPRGMSFDEYFDLHDGMLSAGSTDSIRGRPGASWSPSGIHGSHARRHGSPNRPFFEYRLPAFQRIDRSGESQDLAGEIHPSCASSLFAIRPLSKSVCEWIFTPRQSTEFCSAKNGAS